MSTFYIKTMHEWKNSKNFLWRFQLIFISKNSYKCMQKCLFGRDCINKEWDHHHQLNLSDKTISWFWFENGYCMLYGYRKRKQEKMVKEDGIKWKKREPPCCWIYHWIYDVARFTHKTNFYVKILYEFLSLDQTFYYNSKSMQFH